VEAKENFFKGRCLVGVWGEKEGLYKYGIFPKPKVRLLQSLKGITIDFDRRGDWVES